MKRHLLQLISLISALTLNMNVFAHGDHGAMTPAHGLEHAVWYGIGIVAVLLGLNLGRKIFGQNKK